MDTMNSSTYNLQDTITIDLSDANVYNSYLNTSIYNIESTITGVSGIYGDLTNNGLRVVGDADIEGTLKVAGKDIGESLSRIEERLAILHPNTELEERWQELRSLRQQYMELEAEILEKEKVYKILQK